MAHEANSLFAIEVDADSYASAALEDNPPVSRTYQSEEAFAAIKSSYQAKQHNGNLYIELIHSVPELDLDCPAADPSEEKISLGKREQALFGYVIGEMYYDRVFERVVKLCERLERVGVLEGKFGSAVGRWKGRAEERVKGAKAGMGS